MGLTMKEIQQKLLQAYQNSKCKYTVGIEVRTYDDGQTVTNVWFMEMEEAICKQLVNVFFYNFTEKEWEKNLNKCIAIMKGEKDPFEEE